MAVYHEIQRATRDGRRKRCYLWTILARKEKVTGDLLKYVGLVPATRSETSTSDTP